jgi:hypothetical protein
MAEVDRPVVEVITNVENIPSWSGRVWTLGAVAFLANLFKERPESYG